MQRPISSTTWVRQQARKVIEVQALTKRYGTRIAVDDISFEVARGEIVGFLGPNGAGKTTTLRMLTGFVAPSAGQIRIDGIDAVDQSLRARQRLGYLPEGVPLYREMRVSEYLRYRAELKGVPRVTEAVDRALAQARVTDASQRIIGQLSKGYRQRVGLADALVSDPPLLILDEPTAGLDPNQVRQFRELIRGFRDAKTVFLSTHVLSEVEAVCDRVIIIREGSKVGEGAPAELRRGAETQRVTLRVRARPLELRGVLSALQHMTSLEVEEQGDATLARLDLCGGDDAVASVSDALARARLPVLELRRDETRLEDIFAELTRGDQG